MNPVHTLPTYYLKIHSNIILQSAPRSFEWSLPFRFLRAKSSVCVCVCVFLIPPTRVTWSSHLILSDHDDEDKCWINHPAIWHLSAYALTSLSGFFTSQNLWVSCYIPMLDKLLLRYSAVHNVSFRSTDVIFYKFRDWLCISFIHSFIMRHPTSGLASGWKD
jgi:hypothetical protein